MNTKEYTRAINGLLSRDGWQLLSVGHKDRCVRMMFVDASDCPFTFGDVAMATYNKGCAWTVRLFYPLNSLTNYEARRREEWLKEAKPHE